MLQTVDECLDWMQKVQFKESSFFTQWMIRSKSTDVNRKYFENHLRAMIREARSGRATREEDLFYDSSCSSSRCKVVVLAVNIHGSLSLPIRFRSYRTDSGQPMNNTTIWRVALAAICDPRLLKPIEATQDGRGCYIDASLIGFMNPSREAFAESSALWKHPSAIAVLCNIGCESSNRSFNLADLSSDSTEIAQHAIVRLLRESTLNTQRTSLELDREMKGTYHHFSVDSGLSHISMNDWAASKPGGTIDTRTAEYLEGQDVDLRMHLLGLMFAHEGTIHSSIPAGSNQIVVNHDSKPLSISEPLFAVHGEPSSGIATSNPTSRSVASTCPLRSKNYEPAVLFDAYNHISAELVPPLSKCTTVANKCER